MPRTQRQIRAENELAALRAQMPAGDEAAEPVVRSGSSSAFAALESSDDVEASEEEPEEATQPAAVTSKKRRKKRTKANDAKDKPKLDEIDQALADLGLQPSPPAPATPTTSASSINGPIQLMRALLAIDTRRLDADAELRKMFGARVVNASRAAEPASAQRNARKYRGPPLKNFHLAKALPHWPPPNLVPGGASMEVSQSSHFGPSDEIWFTIEHPRTYKENQADFLEAVASNDVGRFYALLQRSFYHIDTVMALSDMALMQGDAGRSDEFVDQALYAYEYAASTGFSLANGSARLDFSRVENRAMWRALDRKVTSLIKRGCYQTAFETAKVLLLLDPWSDPFGSLLHFEFLAPKARQGKWFLHFLDDYAAAFEQAELMDDARRPRVEAVPGLAFSKALCMFDLEEDAAKSDSEPDHDSSTKELVAAILVFPYLACQLAEKVGVSVPQPFKQCKRAATVEAWQSLKPEMYLHLLAALYVERCHALWKPPEILTWLRKALAAAAPLLDNALNEEVKRGQDLAKGIGLKLETGQAMPINLVRHVMMVGIDSLRPLYPPNAVADLQKSPSYDPLPPKSGTSYDRAYFQGIDLSKVASRQRVPPAPAENGVALLQQLREAAQNFPDMDAGERQALEEQVMAMTEEVQGGVDPEEQGLLRQALARFMNNFWTGQGQAEGRANGVE